VIRRYKNRIKTPKDNNGQYVWDDDSLKLMVVYFYKVLFTKVTDTIQSFPFQDVFLMLNQCHRDHLLYSMSDKDIKKSLV
jgi:hypothetical protein